MKARDKLLTHATSQVMLISFPKFDRIMKPPHGKPPNGELHEDLAIGG
jgi:hypothetical protein